MDYEKMIEQLKRNNRELTGWEADFIESVSDEEPSLLSDKQKETLENIHEKVFA